MKANSLYFTLLKASLAETFDAITRAFRPAKNQHLTEEEKTRSKKKRTGKIAGAFAIGFGLIVMMSYLVLFIFSSTVSAVQAGLQKEFLYMILLIIQIVVLFFGTATTLNYLYFNKDQSLLLSLPVPTKTVFAVKFSLAYLSEIAICAFFALPALITYGVTLATCGIAVSAWFYILGILSILILPVLPLLVISLLSLPLMYVVSFLKKRVVGKAIITVLMAVVVFGLYMLLIMNGAMMGVTEDGETPQLSAGIATTIVGMSKAGLYNYNLVQALSGVNPPLNFLIAVGGLAVLFVIMLLLSSVFYKKGLSVISEEGGASKRKKAKQIGDKSYTKVSFRRSFFIKEIKTILGTSSILMSNIMGIIIIPVFMFMFGKMGMLNMGGEGAGLNGELGFVGLMCYLASIMSASTGVISLIGFSMEGKNIQILKSLPISPKDIALNKLLISNFYCAIIALLTAVSYIIISPYHNAFIAVLIFITLIINGLGSTSIGLYSDLSNPNFKFNSLAELTKNNKRAFKPMIMSVLIGLIYMVLGYILVFAGSAIPTVVNYVIFFGVMLLTNIVFASITVTKYVKGAEKMYESLEV